MNDRPVVLQSLSRAPLKFTGLVLLLYAIWFTAPVLFKAETGTPPPQPVGIDKAMAMLVDEFIIALVLALLVSAVGWWRSTGFQRMEKGSLKFMLIPVIFALVLHQVLTLMAPEEHNLFGFINAEQAVTAVLSVLLLGFNEEMVFRGITYHGFRSVISPLAAVVVAAIIFGLFHYVNMLGGQAFIPTTYQVLHAMAAGFMYGTMRLITGAIWPVMIFHGFWDLNMFSIETVNSLGDTAQTTAAGEIPLSGTVILIYVVPALSYGLFLSWRWSVRNRQKQMVETRL